MHIYSPGSQDEADVLEARLRQLGADNYDIKVPETKQLMKLINSGEQINGIVYGKYLKKADGQTGRGAVAVTSSRILMIDRKPLFSKLDEISFSVISGVSYTKAGIAGTVILHSRIGDIHIRTFNHKCATIFQKSIESLIASN